MELNLIEGTVTLNSMKEDLRSLLDNIDLDFTGVNGSEFYTNEGISQLDSAILTSKHLECIQKRVAYVLEKCENYSSDYYEDFKYTVIQINKNICKVVVATMCEY